MKLANCVRFPREVFFCRNFQAQPKRKYLGEMASIFVFSAWTFSRGTIGKKWARMFRYFAFRFCCLVFLRALFSWLFTLFLSNHPSTSYGSLPVLEWVMTIEMSACIPFRFVRISPRLEPSNSNAREGARILPSVSLSWHLWSVKSSPWRDQADDLDSNENGNETTEEKRTFLLFLWSSSMICIACPSGKVACPVLENEAEEHPKLVCLDREMIEQVAWREVDKMWTKVG